MYLCPLLWVFITKRKLHMSYTTSSTSRPTDITSYHQRLDAVEERLKHYQPITTTTSSHEDQTVAILDAFSKHLPLDGATNICDDILSCHTDADLNALAKELLTAVLIPMMVRDHMLEEVESSTRAAWARLKKACLPRDNYRCVLSGTYDAKASRKLPQSDRDGLITMSTKATYIIPFSIRKFEEHQATIIWDKLYRCFPSLRSRLNFSAEKINEPCNSLMMIRNLHVAFEALAFALEPMHQDNIYRIRKYLLPSWFDQYFPKEDLIKLTNHSPQCPLPSPYILEVHSCVAKILHISGGRKYIRELLWESEQIDCLASDGSTNLEEIMMVCKKLHRQTISRKTESRKTEEG